MGFCLLTAPPKPRSDLSLVLIPEPSIAVQTFAPLALRVGRLRCGLRAAQLRGLPARGHVLCASLPPPLREPPHRGLRVRRVRICVCIWRLPHEAGWRPVQNILSGLQRCQGPHSRSVRSILIFPDTNVLAASGPGTTGISYEAGL